MANDRCTSRKGEPKKRWATEKAARFVADWNVSQKGYKPQGVYHCTTCDGWHTTTIRENERRRG